MFQETLNKIKSSSAKKFKCVFPNSLSNETKKNKQFRKKKSNLVSFPLEQTIVKIKAKSKMTTQKLQDANMNADMTKEMIDEARQWAMDAFEQETQERAIASHIKREFEKKYKGVWHCIVGKNFGSFVTHETKAYIYFYVGQVAVLLWKSVS